jgi:ABC-type polysaccharide transport system permease subunit
MIASVAMFKTIFQHKSSILITLYLTEPITVAVVVAPVGESTERSSSMASTSAFIPYFCSIYVCLFSKNYFFLHRTVLDE